MKPTIYTCLTIIIIFNSVRNRNSDYAKLTNGSKTDTATFAAGCFWATEAAFAQIKGVQNVISGYCGGDSSDATYEKIETGKTGHAESVQIYYDPAIISYDKLLDIFFTAHDATQLNRQGPDIGPQYRSEIFYTNLSQKNQAEEKIRYLNKTKYNQKITTQIAPMIHFYEAEPYHQDYVKHHPNESYIKNVSLPKINKVKKDFSEYLK
ncbi:peptide methionine sulfoxide reductase [Sporocytophaga myxococcoides]|uniref:Peptide methionine sulfoxide reductase MsrA n=1 Tax=Sporocytophaga myxococcoides TaxID=153721 RepID=A0A098LE36_9BACT|nr:peptide-methionine (S)-S-oxide reductase MsrA [Sporocytophaga myxococcoides]GAL84717.1 peptide methionine sulfoxide reductase [Sporocytophaga myxococcoides]